MKVVILCGGKGIRIRDVAGELPKPMVKIGEFPILKHIMDIYDRHGHQEFVLCLGYRGWEIKEYFLNFRAETQDIELDLASDEKALFTGERPVPPWRIVLAETGLESMTGYRIRRIKQYVSGETFMLTYGDGVGDVDVTALLDFHKAHGKLVTMTSVRPPARFGELEIEGSIVTSFQEKPQAREGLINGGFFVCESGVFDYLPDDPGCSFEQEPLSRLAADGELMTYRHDGFWMPMDTSREYALLNELWRSGQAPWMASPPVDA